MGDMPVHDYVMISMDNSYQFIRSIEKYKDSLKSILSSESMNEIANLLFDDVCPYINYFNETETCEVFLRGLTKQGLVPLIANYLMNTRIILGEYEKSDRSEEAKVDYFNNENLKWCSKL